MVTHARQCIWVYCVTAADARRPDRLAGVAGEAIDQVHSAGLTAFAGSVPAADYGAEALRRNLEDLDWLARCAQAHHDVISEIAAHRAVVPMRLATIYQEAVGVREMLAGRSDDLHAALARVTGRSEWGLKGYAPPDGDIVDSMADRPCATRATSNPGTAYLQQRRAALTARDDAMAQLSRSADVAAKALEQVAVSMREHRLHDRSLDPAATDMIFNWSYLVDDSQSAQFASTVNDLANSFPALRLELTGPWPPYSFAALPDQDARQQDAAI